MANRAALIRAENSGLPVTKRGRRFIEFGLSNGQKRLVSTIERLHLADETTEIDTAWVADTGAWQWKLSSTDFQAHARNVFNVGNLYEWRKDDQWIIVDPQSINWINQDTSRQQIAIKQAVTGQVSDATLSFPEGYGSGKHFEYIAHPNQLIKNITIDNLSDLPNPTVTGTIWFEAEFTLSTSSGVELYLDGVKWEKINKVRVKTANRIEFRNTANTETLWYANTPMATDANGDTIICEYEVRRQGGPSSLFITVRVPKTWIDAANFPIVIDPTFTDGFGGDIQTYIDTFINSNVPSTNYGASATLQLYQTVDTWRVSLLKFDVSSLAGATITASTLYLYEIGWGANPYAADVHRILVANSAWTEAGATWDYAVATSVRWEGDAGDDGGADAGCSVSGTDYNAASMGTLSGDGDNPGGTEYEITLSVAQTQSMLDDGDYGLILINDGDFSAQYVGSSDNGTTGYRPKLVVEYTEAADVSNLPRVKPMRIWRGVR